MKASEILKSQSKKLGGLCDELNVAIAEIEELEKPKSCEGCIWNSKYGCTVMLVCIRHPLNIDRYSPKEQL